MDALTIASAACALSPLAIWGLLSLAERWGRRP